MTREEFVKRAKAEIDLAFDACKIRMMKLVERAWAEEKRNADAETVQQIVELALDELEKKQSKKAMDDSVCPYLEMKMIYANTSVEPVSKYSVCFGTPEQDKCTCNGKRSLCNYYDWEVDENGEWHGKCRGQTSEQ